MEYGCPLKVNFRRENFIIEFNVSNVFLLLKKSNTLLILLNCVIAKTQRFCFNPFTAEVAIMRLLGSAPKSHLCDQRRSKVTGLSDLMTLYWPRVFILQTKSIQCFEKHAKRIENWFNRSKVQLTRVWELLTRRWNAWHWESYCVFTAGGERVKVICP
jgi:hypothetical protein